MMIIFPCLSSLPELLGLGRDWRPLNGRLSARETKKSRPPLTTQSRLTTIVSGVAPHQSHRQLWSG